MQQPENITRKEQMLEPNQNMNVAPGLAALVGAANARMNYAWISTGICGMNFGVDFGVNFAWILRGFFCHGISSR